VLAAVKTLGGVGCTSGVSMSVYKGGKMDNTCLLQKALAGSLLTAVLGSTAIAVVDKDFRASYGRVVDALVTGTLGAVSMAGAKALDDSLAGSRSTRKRPAAKATEPPVLATTELVVEPPASTRGKGFKA
jgi:hypothetical protein